MKIKPSSILIGVKDLETSKHFYEKILGMKFEEFRPPFASAYLGNIEFNIEEDTEYRSQDRAEKYIGGPKNISFEVDNIVDFMQLVESNKVNILKPIEEKSRGYKEVLIADSDGNEFIIEQEISKDNNSQVIKTVKFSEPLPGMILSGVKDTTWRINDDKDLRTGDKLSLCYHTSREQFATGKVLWVKNTTFGLINEEDTKGHEKFSSEMEMYETYSKYYKIDVVPETELKVIKFVLD